MLHLDTILNMLSFSEQLTFYCLPQCRLPADLPSDSLVVVTYNSSYMADMKTANVQRRSPPHQYSTVQYSTVKYSTVQYSTVQYLGHPQQADEGDAQPGVAPAALNNYTQLNKTKGLAGSN